MGVCQTTERQVRLPAQKSMEDEGEGLTTDSVPSQKIRKVLHVCMSNVQPQQAQASASPYPCRQACAHAVQLGHGPTHSAARGPQHAASPDASHQQQQGRIAPTTPKHPPGAACTVHDAKNGKSLQSRAPSAVCPSFHEQNNKPSLASATPQTMHGFPHKKMRHAMLIAAPAGAARMMTCIGSQHFQ